VADERLLHALTKAHEYEGNKSLRGEMATAALNIDSPVKTPYA
jgi:hypothetical protein